jgi:hypothetical protein
MKVTRAHNVLAAGLLALTTAAGATVLAAGPASARSSQVVVDGCNGHGQVRPTRLETFNTCMASQEFVGGLHWTSWQQAAFGHGQLNVNNCIPTCAQGKYIKYPILTVLWRPRPWSGHPGRAYFSRLTWIFTGKRPLKHSPAAQTMPLPDDLTSDH